MIAVFLPVGGNRTHVTVSKDLLRPYVTVPQDLFTTIAEYHSAIEIHIKFDQYFDSRVVLGDHRNNILRVHGAGSIPADCNQVGCKRLIGSSPPKKKQKLVFEAKIRAAFFLNVSRSFC